MKTLKYLLFIVFVAQMLHAQSNIVIGVGSTIDVGVGSDVCAGTYGNISGNLIGDGTQCFAAVPKVLNLVALIEGFYDGSAMVPDTVTIQMRNTVSPYTVADQKKVVLNTSGAGTGSLTNVTNGTAYYIFVQHRNSIETWSGTGKSFTSNLLNYDFTTASSQAYGDNMKLKGTKWTIFSGDVNQDGVVDLSDVSLVDTDNLNFVGGYTVTDVNGDLLVDLSDVSIVDVNNLSFVSKVIPSKMIFKKQIIPSQKNLNKDE